jgi:outer membrane usher protein
VRAARSVLAAGAFLVATAASAVAAPPIDGPDASLRAAAAAASSALAEDRDAPAQPAYLQLVVNTVAGEPVLVLLDRADVWVAATDLALRGVAPQGGLRRLDGGRELVALASLAPALTYEVDERDLALRITAGRALLGRAGLDLAPLRRPADLETAATSSAILDYGITGTTDRTLSGSGELALGFAGNSARGSVSWRSDGTVVRGLTAIAREAPERLMRFTLGEAAVRPEPLGGAPIVAGLSIARDATLDPYHPRAPLPRATLFAPTPSSLEVWVNGALVRTVPVGAGTLDLSNLPVTTGRNDVRLVLRDAFGRTEAVDTSHYQAQALLAPGLHEYAWSVGAVRERYAVESFAFGEPVLLGAHRLGLTDALTLGARLEASPEVISGGLGAVVAIGLGELQLAASASHRDDPGAAALAAWRLALGHTSLGADLTWASRKYATVAPDVGAPPRWRAGLLAAHSAGRSVGLSLRATAGAAADGARDRRLEAASSLALWRGISLQVAAALSHGSATGTALSGSLSLFYSPAARTSVEASTEVSDGVAVSRTAVQRTRPGDEGLGYRLAGATTRGRTDLSALVEAQGSMGRVEGRYERLGDAGVGSLSATGGLVLVDGGLFASRAVDESFALVRVPGVGGVRAYLDNRPAGRTNAKGDLLVTGLLPGYGNRLSIADADVPIGFTIGRVERMVGPPRRGAVLVRFEVEPVRAVLGRIGLAPTGGPLPRGATLELVVDGRRFTSPIGSDGTFWIEGLPVGPREGRVAWAGGACQVAISVPEDAPGIAELGELGCRPEPVAPERPDDTRL